jgi:multiple sugar transport system substrate-binding protein
MKKHFRNIVALGASTTFAAATLIAFDGQGAFAARKAAKPVEITFASWWDPKIIQNDINQFNATHPGIHVTWDKSVTWDWNQHLAAAAAAGKFPDVTMVFDIPSSVANKWLLNLNPYLRQDKTYNPKNIFGNLTQTGMYFGNQYALPLSLFAGGIEINTDLFKAANIPVPGPNWTLQQMRQDAIKLTNFDQHQFGMQNVRSLREIMIPQFDPKEGWLTWDGSKYNFTKPAFANSVNLVNQLLFQDKVTPDIYDQKTKDAWYGKDKDPWTEGKVAMQPGYSWDFPGMKNLKFHTAFLPLPRVVGQRVPLVTDYIGISRTTKHPKEAFEFMRWLAYSKDGWMYRMTSVDPVDSIPLINDTDVWNEYLSKKYIPSGMKDVLKMIPKGFIDGWKWLPGYPNVLTKIVGPNYDKFEKGTAKPEDLAADFQKRATQEHINAMIAMRKAVLGK